MPSIQDVKLITPEPRYLAGYLDLCRELWDKGVRLHSLHDPDRFEEWKDTLFRRYEDGRQGRGLAKGMVPFSVFWLVEVGEVIGTVNLRHSLTESLRRIGGHIGYCIRPSHWGKGYGTLQLRLALEEAAKLGLEQVMLTCDESNGASARVMEKCGARWMSTLPVIEGGVTRRIRRCRIDTPAAANCYLRTAHLYDFNNREVMTEDVAFYLDLAEQKGGSVLELACGTGRILLELAKQGHPVTGVDLSPAMLGRLREKQERLPDDIARRTALVQAGMASFELESRFDLIVIPFRSFQALLTEEEAVACLERVRRHLAPGGWFSVNVLPPHGPMGVDWCYPELVQWRREDPETGLRIVKKARGDTVDAERRIFRNTYIYEVTTADGSFERLEEPLAMRYYTREQIRELLERCGFSIEEEYGWYDKSPVSPGRDLIYICR
ncbi:GNAT family N-acetyltransferase [Ruminococcaceae bacterium OttesenSCG-928-L11]|nr:GNAT family N-acetyltransferase [Ruminococcaceae bacterium OttesenSCG-928-L11]